MALEKLSQLHQALDNANLVASEQLDSWAEDGKMVLAASDRRNGLVVCRFRYQGIYTLEGYTKTPDLLMAVVCTFLIEFDEERDQQKLSAPDIDIEMVDDDTANISINVDFEEKVELVKDDNGPILFKGIRYSTGSIAHNDVTDVGVDHLTGRDTDKRYQDS
ncbi:MAG: phage tail protein [Cellvibrionaceae bacterium]